jgi:uncharacterized RDD family membrane protein YckC
VAYSVDFMLAAVLLAVSSAAIAVAVALLTGDRVQLQVDPELGVPTTALFGFLYFFVSWALVSKTAGMALLGLHVVRRDGSPLTVGRAAIRALVLPFSFILGLGLIGVVVGRENRALHDVAAGTVVAFE